MSEPAATIAIVRISDGSRTYGGIAALAVEAFEIEQGARVLVSGTNASGKSTLLRVVAGLSQLTSGSLELAVASWRWRVGYLPQTGGLYLDLTARENSAIVARLLGGRVNPEEARSLAGLLGLTHDLDKPCSALSGGVQRVAAIYALLASRADVLILDEPTSALDTRRQAQVYRALEARAPSCQFLLVAEHLARNGVLWHMPFWTKTIWLGEGAGNEFVRA